MSKSLLLCIVLLLCAACIPGDQPAAGPGNPFGLNERQCAAMPNFGRTTGLAAGQPIPLLWAIFQADPSWTQSAGRAGAQAADREEVSQLIGFDPGLLPELGPQELVELVTWEHRGVRFEGDWSAQGLKTVVQGLQMTLGAFGGDPGVMMAALDIAGQEELLYRVCADCFETGNHFSQPEQHRVTFDSSPDLVSFLHETGHIVDYYLARSLRTDSRWWSEEGFLGLGWQKQVHQSGEAGVYYIDTNRDAAHSAYSPREDFADTFAAWVLEENHQPLPRGWRNPSTRRVLLLGSVPAGLLD